MSLVLLTGIVTVNLALVLYTIGFVAEQRRRRATPGVLAALGSAVLLDLVATGCMMAGSRKPLLTPHGIVGYSALAAMIVAVALVWAARGRGALEPVPRGPHVFLRVAYAWWVVAYVLGAAMAMRG